jgi:hypothetical protein
MRWPEAEDPLALDAFADRRITRCPAADDPDAEEPEAWPGLSATATAEATDVVSDTAAPSR